VPGLRPEVVTGDRAETIEYPADLIRVTKQDEGDVQVAIYESTDREGSPLHRHPWAELQIVVDGAAEFLVGEGSWTGGGSGTVQFLPRGVAHAVRVPQGRARIVQVSIGDPYDGFARDMARAFADHAPLARIVELAAEHGVELA
jgi:quercetin dioxygenase-like cupin family protein